MRFEVLGPLRLRRTAEVISVSGTLRRSLLAMLLARANESVPVDTLVNALWGEQPAPGREQRLHVHVHKLRALLGEPGRLSFGPGGYSLQVLPGELDAEEFDTLVDEATSVAEDDPQRCAELIRKALNLFRGTPYQGVDAADLAGEIQRCSERKLAALEELYGAELRRGRHAAIIDELSDSVRQHPLRERMHGLLMTALHQGGRQADALAAYRNAQEILVEELGLEPGPELREIEQQVRAGAPVVQGREANRVPAQLPNPPASFVGREQELDQLDAMLSRNNESAVIMALAGTGGVGKTALALHWAHRVRGRFPDGQLYVDLRGYGPDDPVPAEEALAGFLHALGMDGASIPNDLSERASRLRSFLADTRTLLVLDNARTPEQVRPLMPATPGCVVVVTSRDPLVGLAAKEGAHRVALDQLSMAEARELLRNLLGADRAEAEPVAVDRVIQRCARLPLPLRIAAERVRLRPNVLIDDLVGEMEPQEWLDLRPDADGDLYFSVRAVLSWSYQHLPHQAAELFRLWGLHPGHDIDIDALVALTGQDRRGTRHALEALRRAHLVGESIAGRYHLHDLLRLYAGELTREFDDEFVRHAAQTRLFEHYLATAEMAMQWVSPQDSELPAERATGFASASTFSCYETALRWLDVERANLVQVVEHAPDRDLPTYTTDLSAVLWPYLDLGWHPDDGGRVHARALQVAQQRGDRVAEGIARRSLGLGHHRLNQNDEAIVHFKRALDVQQELGESRSQAVTHGFLAGAYELMGRLDDAIEHVERALELFEGFELRGPQGRMLSRLGHLRRHQGCYEQARSCFERSLEIAEQIDHWPSKANSLSSLARLCLDNGQEDDAVNYAHSALAIGRVKGMRALENAALDILGVAYRRLGQHEEAISHQYEALAFASTSGDDSLMGRAFNGLAESFATTGVKDEAHEYFTKALTISPASEAARKEQARAHSGLGEIHVARSEHEKAVEHWQAALDTYLDLQDPEAAEIAAKLARISQGEHA